MPVDISDTRTADQIAADIEKMGQQTPVTPEAPEKPETPEVPEEKPTEEKPVEKPTEETPTEEKPEEEEDIEVEDLEEIQEDPDKPLKEQKPEGEEDDLSDDDKKLVDQAVEKRMTPFLQQQAQEAERRRNDSFDKYIKDNPHLAKYADKIRPYIHKMYDPMVKNGINGIKASESTYFDRLTGFVLGTGLLKIGARMEKAAAGKAGKGSQSAGGNRPADKSDLVPDFANMNAADFKKIEDQVLDGTYKM